MTPGQQHGLAVVGVPIFLFLVSFLAKALARGARRGHIEDLYQGPEATLAAITAITFYLLELSDSGRVSPEVLKSAVSLLLVAFLLFLGSLVLQRLPGLKGGWRVFVLAGLCNFAGYGMIGAVIALKGFRP